MITAREALKLAQEWNEKAIAHYEADVYTYAHAAATIALTYATMSQSRVIPFGEPEPKVQLTRSGEPIRVPVDREAIAYVNAEHDYSSCQRTCCLTTTTLGDVSAEPDSDDLAKRYGGW